MPPPSLTDSFSSLVLRCGPSITEFVCLTPLSDAATSHLVHLPHLRYWTIIDPPPNYSTSSLPLPTSFPPLTQFRLGGDGVRGWISLFGCLAASVPGVQGGMPLSRVRESLETLDIINYPNSITNLSLISPIQIFHNLAFLNVEVSCHDRDGDDRCSFELNDDNAAELAMALPHMCVLRLGRPCFKNTCATTVACLLQISVYCLELESLEIHFNTRNVVEDFKSISMDPRFEQLRSLPRCSLSCLEVSRAPLALDKPGFETVANGMVDIFPSIERCKGFEGAWDDVSGRISKLRALNMLWVSVCFRLPLHLTHSRATGEPVKGYSISRDTMAGWIGPHNHFL